MDAFEAQQAVNYLIQCLTEVVDRLHARAILEEVNLEGMEDRRPAQLSGGQQQRVAVARAIVSQPSLVLADEPTANLDSHAAAHLMQLFLDLNAQVGSWKQSADIVTEGFPFVGGVDLANFDRSRFQLSRRL